jgi:hypothetical protein
VRVITLCQVGQEGRSFLKKKFICMCVIFLIAINGYKKAGYHRGWQPHGRLYPKTARKQRPRKSTWGRTWAKAQVMPMKWRHLIRRPAKLTGTRHELCTWGDPTRPGVGSLSRAGATPSTLNKTGRAGTADQWISGSVVEGRRSHGGAEARREQREESTTRHKGN